MLNYGYQFRSREAKEIYLTRGSIDTHFHVILEEKKKKRGNHTLRSDWLQFTVDSRALRIALRDRKFIRDKPDREAIREARKSTCTVFIKERKANDLDKKASHLRAILEIFGWIKLEKG